MERSIPLPGPEPQRTSYVAAILFFRSTLHSTCVSDVFVCCSAESTTVPSEDQDVEVVELWKGQAAGLGMMIMEDE